MHPGESNASWMMKGLLDMLLNPTKEEEKIAEFLKEEFEFYIVPMLNVDGVINGNYRCSLAACDLNRKWSNPNKILHPTIYNVKNLCMYLQEELNKNFYLYLDMHGHSIKYVLSLFVTNLERMFFNMAIRWIICRIPSVKNRYSAQNCFLI